MSASLNGSLLAGSVRRLALILIALQVMAPVAFGETTVTPLALASLRDIGGHDRGGISLSPDGRWVAFQLQEPDLDQNSYRLTWMVVDANGDKFVRQLGGGGDLILNPTKYYIDDGNRPQVRPLWDDQSKRIFYLLKRDGETQLWSSDVGSGTQARLTDGRGDVVGIEWSADKTRILIKRALPPLDTENELAAEARRGFLVDDRVIPYIGPRPLRRFCDDYAFDAVSLERTCSAEASAYDLATKTETPISTEASDRNVRPKWLRDQLMKMPAGPGRRGNFAWFQVQDKSAAEAMNPVVRLRAGRDYKSARTCQADACTGAFFDGLWWAGDGEKVYFLRGNGRGTRSDFYSWNTRTGELRSVYGTDDYLYSCDVHQDRVTCLREGSTVPRQIVTIHLNSGEALTVFDPNPQFKDFTFTRVEALEWADKFGNPAYGRLVYPRGYVAGKRYPLVVTTMNARGFLRGDTGDEYPVHAFADAGMFVLSASRPIDLEAMTRMPHGKMAEFLERDLHRRKSNLSSLETVLDQLDRRGIIDDTKIGITGLSDGAQQVHYSLINSRRKFAAASVSSLVTGEIWYYMDVTHQREQLRQWWSGPPKTGNPHYDALSYRRNVVKVDAPILINVNQDEFSVSFPEFAALQDAGKPVEMHVFPDEHHIKWQPIHRFNIYRRNLQWFMFWLQNRESDDPVDANQYDRWRHLAQARKS